jgi:hypothetical protein
MYCAKRFGVRRVRFDGSPDEYRDTSVDAALADGRLAAPPPGLAGYTVAFEKLALVFDTRPSRMSEPFVPASDFEPPPGSGARAVFGAQYSSELESRAESGDTARQWLTYGSSLAGYLDLTGQQRTLGLGVSARCADPIGPALPIPFTKLPSLGGNELMRGFRPLRLIDRSAIAATLNYRWPIWAYLDGNLDISIGNVFGARLAGFEWERLRLSADIGFRTLGSLDYPFEVLVGFGTETFESGAGIESFRLIFGTSNLF